MPDLCQKFEDFWAVTWLKIGSRCNIYIVFFYYHVRKCLNICFLLIYYMFSMKIIDFYVDNMYYLKQCVERNENLSNELNIHMVNHVCP